MSSCIFLFWNFPVSTSQIWHWFNPSATKSFLVVCRFVFLHSTRSWPHVHMHWNISKNFALVIRLSQPTECQSRDEESINPDYNALSSNRLRQRPTYPAVHPCCCLDSVLPPTPDTPKCASLTTGSGSFHRWGDNPLEMGSGATMAITEIRAGRGAQPVSRTHQRWNCLSKLIEIDEAQNVNIKQRGRRAMA